MASIFYILNLAYLPYVSKVAFDYYERSTGNFKCSVHFNDTDNFCVIENKGTEYLFCDSLLDKSSILIEERGLPAYIEVSHRMCNEH